MENQSALIVFDSNPHVAGDRLISWSHGPVKMEPTFPRGRPRKDVPRRSEATSKYHFVACPEGTTDASLRTSVRSHVMRRRKLTQGHPENKNVEVGRHAEHLAVDHVSDPVFPQQIASFDPFGRLPVRIEPYMIVALNKYTTISFETVFPIEKYATEFNPMRDYFLPMAMEDSALFHAILFSAEAYALLSGRYKEAPQSLVHLKECIRLINERMRSNSPATSDSTIAIVATIAYVEKHVGHYKNWQIHMRGLKQMIQLRGGLRIFQSNRVLYNKILRTDLCGSIDANAKPFFDESLAAQPVPNTPDSYTSIGFNKLRGRFGFTGDLNRILRRIEDSTAALNQVHRGIKSTHPQNIRDELTSVQYALLRLSRSPNMPAKMEQICRRGLQLYLITILNQFPPGAVACDNFAATLKADLTEEGRKVPIDFQCWLVLLIGTSVCDEVQIRWARRTFAAIALQPSFPTKEDMKAKLNSFFWVDKVHDPRLARLWNDALPLPCT